MVGAGKKNNDKLERFQKEALVHIDSLYNTAYQLTRNRADAEDLVQETYLKAYRSFGRFETGTNCKAWLFKIMRNTFLNQCRKRSREPQQYDFDELADRYQAEDFDLASSKAEWTVELSNRSVEAMMELLDDDVKRALDELPESFRTAVILSDLEGFSYKEIADILNCPIGTVMSRLFRGRRILRKKLLDFAERRGLLRNKSSDEGE